MGEASSQGVYCQRYMSATRFLHGGTLFPACRERVPTSLGIRSQQVGNTFPIKWEHRKKKKLSVTREGFAGAGEGYHPSGTRSKSRYFRKYIRRVSAFTSLAYLATVNERTVTLMMWINQKNPRYQCHQCLKDCVWVFLPFQSLFFPLGIRTQPSEPVRHLRLLRNRHASRNRTGLRECFSGNSGWFDYTPWRHC